MISYHISVKEVTSYFEKLYLTEVSLAMYIFELLTLKMPSPSSRLNGGNLI